MPTRQLEDLDGAAECVLLSDRPRPPTARNHTIRRMPPPEWKASAHRRKTTEKEEPIVTRIVDRPFDWVAALAFASGAVVMVPSLAALGLAVITMILALL